MGELQTKNTEDDAVNGIIAESLIYEGKLPPDAHLLALNVADVVLKEAFKDKTLAVTQKNEISNNQVPDGVDV